MWLNRGRAPTGRIVSPEAFDRFATPHPGTLSEDGSRGYAFGIGVLRREGHELLRHDGGMVGFIASARADMTDGLGVAVLLNGPDADVSMARYALDAWQAAIAGEPLPDPLPADPPSQVDSSRDYAGRFTASTGESLEFAARADRLLLMRGSEAIAIDRTGRDAFYTPLPGLDHYPFTFGRDDDGQVVEVTHGPAWYVNERYTGPLRFDTPEAWSAYVGRYRNYSPWFPYFEIVLRKGRLLAITGEGGETASGETVLVPAGEGMFQIGEEITPETLRFEEVVAGRAFKAVWSGQPFFRR